MFKTGDDNMRMGPTPERVYALCRVLLRGEQTKDMLFEKLSMSSIFADQNDNDLRSTYNAAAELGLVDEVDGVCKLAVSPVVLENMDAFRRQTARVAFSRPDTLFARTCTLFLTHAEEVMVCHSWEQVVDMFHQQGLRVSENDLLGWRFWMSFLGLGYWVGSSLIPNACQRIRAALDVQERFPLDAPIEVNDFFTWLESECPELRKSRDEIQIGLAVSHGLRVLQEQGVLEFVAQPDASYWKLQALESEPVNAISHIKIVGCTT